MTPNESTPTAERTSEGLELRERLKQLADGWMLSSKESSDRETCAVYRLCVAELRNLLASQPASAERAEGELPPKLIAALERWRQHKNRKDDARSPYYAGTFDQCDEALLLLSRDMRLLSDFALQHADQATEPRTLDTSALELDSSNAPAGGLKQPDFERTIQDGLSPSSADTSQKHLTQLIADTCEDDTAIRKLASEVIGSERTYGDTYCVPGIVEVVEMTVAQLRSELSEARAESKMMQKRFENMARLSASRGVYLSEYFDSVQEAGIDVEFQDGDKVTGAPEKLLVWVREARAELKRLRGEG